jgi:predicted dehydrogenase
MRVAIRVTVAGLGARGRDWVREVRGDAGLELAACVDVDDGVLREAAARLDIPHDRCFTDVDAALQKRACDAVIVATPADLHAGVCEAALTRGLGVLVEKPFTTRLGEAVRLVRLAERERAPLVVAQNYRYMRSYRTARRLVRDGTLGRVGMVACQYYRVPHGMAASLARLPHSILWGIGVHHLDALRHVLGQEVVGVVAESFERAGAFSPRGASLQVLLSFDAGARAMYSATYESSGHEFFERGQEFYARFVGERATLHVLQRWLFVCERGRWPRLVRRGSRPVTEERLLLRQLEGAMLRGEVPDASGRDNLQTMAVVEACVRSAAERRWINPKELLDEHE